MSLYLCDTNIWVALAIGEHVHNALTSAWLDSVDEPASVLFCRSTQQSFLRLLTVPAITAHYRFGPLSNADAWSSYRELIADERISFQAEPAGIEQQWRSFSDRGMSSSALWMDAYLAAFAVTLGCQLVTTDAGFRQFRGLNLLLLTP